MPTIADYDWVLVQEAVKRWRKIDQDKKLFMHQMYSFADFLGCRGVNPDKIINTDDPEIQRLIDLINGPHSKAILKLLELKYEERKAKENSSNQVVPPQS